MVAVDISRHIWHIAAMRPILALALVSACDAGVAGAPPGPMQVDGRAHAEAPGPKEHAPFIDLHSPEVPAIDVDDVMEEPSVPFEPAATDVPDGRLCTYIDGDDPVDLPCALEVNNEIAPGIRAPSELRVIAWNLHFGADSALGST